MSASEIIIKKNIITKCPPDVQRLETNSTISQIGFYVLYPTSEKRYNELECCALENTTDPQVSTVPKDMASNPEAILVNFCL